MSITLYTIPNVDTIKTMRYRNGVWMAIVVDGNIYTGTAEIIRSTDGISWVSTGITANPLRLSQLEPLPLGGGLSEGSWAAIRSTGGDFPGGQYTRSRDDGQTWDPWVDISSGQNGDYSIAPRDTSKWALFRYPIVSGENVELYDLTRAGNGASVIFRESLGLVDTADIFFYSVPELPPPSYFILDFGADTVFEGSPVDRASASQDLFVAVYHNGFSSNSREIWVSSDNTTYTLRKEILDNEVHLEGAPEHDPDQGKITRFAYDAVRETWVAFYSYPIDTANQQRGHTLLAADKNFQTMVSSQLDLPFGMVVNDLLLINDTWYAWGGDQYLTMPPVSVGASSFWTNFVRTREVCT